MTDATRSPGTNELELVASMVLFERIIREGSLSAAAAAMGLSKATVSKRLAQFESLSGVRLLHRNTRSIQPTDTGRIFLERCKAVVALVEDAHGLLASTEQGIHGSIRLSVPASFGRAFLFEPIATFMRRFPGVQLDVDVSDVAVDLVEERFDFAIRVGPVGDLDLVVRKLCETRKVVVASPRLLEETGPIHDPTDLTQQPCLLYTNQSDRDRWVFRNVDGDEVKVPVRGRLRSGSGDALAAAAREGLGFAWLPDFIVRDSLRRGELALVLDENCHVRAGVRVVLPSRQLIPARVAVFIEHLQNALMEKQGR